MSNELTIQHEQRSIASIQPQDMMQAMKLADMVSKSKMIPKDFQDKPEECLLVIMQASQWGLSPLAVFQGASVIHGKLMLEGKLVAALVNSLSNIQGNLNYRYEGEGDKRVCTAFGTMHGETEPREASVILGDVRTSQWNAKQYDQRLAYSAARQWARRHTPEVIMGIYADDEAPLIQEHAPPKVSNAVTALYQDHDPETGEVVDNRSDKQKQNDWAAKYITQIHRQSNLQDLYSLNEKYKDALAVYQDKRADLYEEITAAIFDREAQLKEAA